MNLQFGSDDLFTNRISELTSLLKTISPNSKLTVDSFSLQGSVIFYSSDVKEHSREFRNFRFKTISSRMNASYYEIWNPVDKRSLEYYLERAYLHIYCQDKDYLNIKADGEFILLHSDPNIKESEAHYEYKVGPHIHLQFAPYNLQHAHIAIELGNLDRIFISRKEFDSSLKRAFVLIKNQVLATLQ